MKEKVKEFWEEHKGEVVLLAYYGIGLGLGYLAGKSVTMTRFNIGINRCFAVKPELEPMLVEAVELAKKNKK